MIIIGHIGPEDCSYPAVHMSLHIIILNIITLKVTEILNLKEIFHMLANTTIKYLLPMNYDYHWSHCLGGWFLSCCPYVLPCYNARL